VCLASLTKIPSRRRDYSRQIYCKVCEKANLQETNEFLDVS